MQRRKGHYSIFGTTYLAGSGVQFVALAARDAMYSFEVEMEQRPSRLSLLRLIRHHFHWKCLLSTLLVLLCIAYAIWCHITAAAYAGTPIIHKYAHGPCSQGYNFIPIALGLLLYLIYLTECWQARSKYTDIVMTSATEANQYVSKLRAATPIVWWKSVCYHYLRRSRQVTRYRNGDAVTATQIYYERVNSHTSGNVFMFDVCGVKDISKPLTHLEDYPVVRMRFSKGFVFACVQAANEFEEQRTRFFNENESRDDYMEVREGLDLVETPFIENMIVYTKSGKKPPWYLRTWVYWLFSGLLMSWCIRMIAELCTAHVHYQATKLFGTSYLSPSSINYTGPLTRSETIESTELERAIRENYLIVPSYSEAVLLDPLASGNNNFLLPHLRHRIDASGPISNEHVITNYGAVGGIPRRVTPNSNVNPPPTFSSMIRPSPRSKSMCFTPENPPGRPPVLPSYNNQLNQALPRPRDLALKSISTKSSSGPTRSISIAGFGTTSWSSGYYSQSATPLAVVDERRPLIEPMTIQPPPNEPPPSYEVALRMCAPIYSRLRQSANSISSLLNSLSRSNSKDLRQYSFDGQQPPP
uniref:Transmembrane protein 151B n=1 Tax=Panagrellus redivivus TaxID=6233 RepID=A0A7E4ZUE5_PANRE